MTIEQKIAGFTPEGDAVVVYTMRNDKGAAEIVKDSEAVESGFAVVEAMVADRERLDSLATNIKALAIADSADRVAEIACRAITE